MSFRIPGEERFLLVVNFILGDFQVHPFAGLPCTLVYPNLLLLVIQVMKQGRTFNIINSNQYS